MKLPTIPPGLAGKIVKNHPLLEPIRLQDLKDSASSIRGHVGAQKAMVNGVYGVNDEIVITSKLVKSIWFFCSVSNFALSKVNFIELVSKT